MMYYKRFTIKKKYPKLKIMIKATQNVYENNTASGNYALLIEDYEGNIISTSHCSDNKLNTKITNKNLDYHAERFKYEGR